MSDRKFQEIYVDRDTSHWVGRIVSDCCQSTFRWIDVGRCRDNDLPLKQPLCGDCGAWCGLRPRTP